MKPKKHQKLKVVRKAVKILGDTSRVITLLHLPDDKSRVARIIRRITSLPETETKKLMVQIRTDFSSRHDDIEYIFERHMNEVKGYLPRDANLSNETKALIGAYFTKEYAIESAALFNPSIVPHPDQRHLDKGSLRFVMSLRATGDGHVSSIAFRSGILDRRNTFHFDPISEFVETPELQLDPDPVYKHDIFQRKLSEMGAGKEVTAYILNQLPEDFTYKELKDKIGILHAKPQFSEKIQNKTFKLMRWLADSNYEVGFHADHRISERVLFPVAANESKGIEDARFVQFISDNNEIVYYATYTAYDGTAIFPQLIKTKDFIKFNISTLHGKAVKNKGLALFPRKIGGRYAMLSRQDGENNYLMFSDDIHFWQKYKMIQEPELPWEFMQLGNCGSPLETDQGWILLTHGVGPMRQYCLGAILLDLKTPTKIIARLDEPLLAPNQNEREGYVPNVVYSCGAIIHNNELVIPYAMSDINSGIATVAVNELLNCMRKVV